MTKEEDNKTLISSLYENNITTLKDILSKTGLSNVPRRTVELVKVECVLKSGDSFDQYYIGGVLSDRESHYAIKKEYAG